eukprot:4143977-Amphidinium_carterae.1
MAESTQRSQSTPCAAARLVQQPPYQHIVVAQSELYPTLSLPLPNGVQLGRLAVRAAVGVSVARQMPAAGLAKSSGRAEGKVCMRA